MGEKLLQVQDLRVSYHTYAGEVQSVRGVSFAVEKGETLAIVGESGCGKSVTAKSIMGLFSLDLSQPVQVEVHGTDAQRGAFQADVAAFRVDAGQ